MTADIGRPEQQVTGWASECGRGPAWGTSVNLPVPAGTGDASWLRAFHAVVQAVVRAFGPEVLVTHHGADTHREDPLADLNLTVDWQRPIQARNRRWRQHPTSRSTGTNVLSTSRSRRGPWIATWAVSAEQGRDAACRGVQPDRDDQHGERDPQRFRACPG